MRLSLVIPCYNEARNLPALIERCGALIADDPAIEVILVDNGSNDSTPAVLADLLAPGGQIRSIRVERNQGYGHGILSGLRAAEGEILAWTHADQQTDPVDARQGLDFFRVAANPERLFVKGRRYGRPLVDTLFTTGMSVFETLLTRRRMSDINAQPTMFHRSQFAAWRDPPDDFALDLYAYWQARDLGCVVRRFPVLFGPRAFGTSHWNTGMKARMKFVRRTLAFSFALKRSKR
ncbi:glycosyltransferase family 2 protein [Sphingomonas sp. MA1305]|uniref:glycosyltransferase family 2 protein n=1 Tax=Sphingomonas sp. MA1305 TaxID=2479204 RepID=UPI0022B759F1|nr:glycosyltransferase family 2 protein [Sphingomonas sp. MA1305]MBI0477182.1 glycosyltransferase family 2 protein [Sphingomonas sp. MA1305]